MKKLFSVLFATVFGLCLTLPALADVVWDPFFMLHDTKSWVFAVAVGIALIALALLVYLVLKARRNK